MPVKIIREEKDLITYLTGEIDHHSAKNIREEIDAEIMLNKPEVLVMDFKNVGFMDSSGIGLVMGRYKIVQENGGKIIVQNTSSPIKKVMRLAGLDRIATFRDETIKGQK